MKTLLPPPPSLSRTARALLALAATTFAIAFFASSPASGEDHAPNSDEHAGHEHPAGSDEHGFAVEGVIVEEVTVQTPDYPSRIVTLDASDGNSYLVATVGGLDRNGNYMIASHAAELPLKHKVRLELLPAPSNRVADLRAAGYDGPEDAVIYQAVGGIEGEEIVFRAEGTTDDGLEIGTSGLRASYSTYEIHWASFPVKFHLNPAGGPVSSTKQASAMKAALGMWSGVSCSDFRGSYAGTSSKPGNRTEDNGINLVYWDAKYFKDTGNPLRLGEAWRRFNPKTWELVDVEIVLNGGQTITYPATASTYDLQSLMAHELGHAIGFKHVSDAANVMNTYLANNKNYRSLGPLDLKAIKYIYQAPSCGGVSAGGGTSPTPTPTPSAKPLVIKNLSCYGNVSPLDPDPDGETDPEAPVEDPTQNAIGADGDDESGGLHVANGDNSLADLYEAANEAGAQIMSIETSGNGFMTDTPSEDPPDENGAAGAASDIVTEEAAPTDDENGELQIWTSNDAQQPVPTPTAKAVAPAPKATAAPQRVAINGPGRVSIATFSESEPRVTIEPYSSFRFSSRLWELFRLGRAQQRWTLGSN